MFIEIWEDISFRLILKDHGVSCYDVPLLFCWSWPGDLDILQKRGLTEKGGINFETEDWGTSVQLSWELRYKLKLLLCLEAGREKFVLPGDGANDLLGQRIYLGDWMVGVNYVHSGLNSQN